MASPKFTSINQQGHELTSVHDYRKLNASQIEFQDRCLRCGNTVQFDVLESQAEATTVCEIEENMKDSNGYSAIIPIPSGKVIMNTSLEEVFNVRRDKEKMHLQTVIDHAKEAEQEGVFTGLAGLRPCIVLVEGEHILIVEDTDTEHDASKVVATIPYGMPSFSFMDDESFKDKLHSNEEYITNMVQKKDDREHFQFFHVKPGDYIFRYTGFDPSGTYAHDNLIAWGKKLP